MSTTTLDTTSLTTSSWQLSKFKKRSKMLPPMACQISRERLKPGSRKFYKLIGDSRSTNLQDMTSLAVSGWLPDAIKYCTKVRKTGVAGIEVHNSVTV